MKKLILLITTSLIFTSSLFANNTVEINGMNVTIHIKSNNSYIYFPIDQITLMESRRYKVYYYSASYTRGTYEKLTEKSFNKLLVKWREFKNFQYGLGKLKNSQNK